MAGQIADYQGSAPDSADWLKEAMGVVWSPDTVEGRTKGTTGREQMRCESTGSYPRVYTTK